MFLIKLCFEVILTLFINYKIKIDIEYISNPIYYS